MVDDVDIPLTVSIPNLARVNELVSALTGVLNQAGFANDALERTGQIKSFLTLASQVKQLQKTVEDLGNVAGLNKLATDAARAGKAVDEQLIQKLLSSKQELAAFARSNSFEKVTAATEAYGRKLDEAKLKLERLIAVQGEGTARQQLAAEQRVAAKEAELRKIEENLAFAQNRLNAIRQEQGIANRVSTRQQGVEVTRRFEDTPEGREIAAAKRARTQDLAERNNFDRDAKSLTTKQNLERSVEVADAQAIDRALTRKKAADDRAVEAHQNFIRAQEVGDAKAIDQAIERQARADARALTAKQNLERAVDVGDAQAIDRALTRKNAAETRALEAHQNFIRAQEVGDATAIDRSLERQTRADARLLTAKQNLERSVEVADARAIDQAISRKTAADARATEAQKNFIRAQEVGDAKAIDQARDRQAKADAARITAKQNLDRAVEVADARAIDQKIARDTAEERREAEQDNRAFDRAVARNNRLRVQEFESRAKADARLLTAKQNLERAVEVADARAIDQRISRDTAEERREAERDNRAFDRATARLNRLRAQAIQNQPENQAASQVQRDASRLATGDQLASNEDFITQRARLANQRQAINDATKARQGELLPPGAGPTQDQLDQQQAKVVQARRDQKARVGQILGDRPAQGDETLIEEFGRRAKVLAEYAALGVAFAALGATFESVLHLENALKEISAISGSTAAELDKMRTVIIETSVATPFASKEITNLAREMVSAGISSHEVTASLKSIALLASATGGNLQKVGEIFVSAFEVFKIRGTEAGTVADQLAVTLNHSRLEANGYASVLQTVSTTAAESGLSFTQLNAALGALSNQGLRTGTLLSTGFRQILVDLEDPPKKLAARFHELGLSSADLDVKALGLTGVLANLSQAGFTTADAFASLPARTAQAFAAFLKSGGDIKQITEEINNASGAAAQNATRMESLENQLKRLGNSFIALTQTGAGPLIGVLKETASGLTYVTTALGSAGTAASVVTTILTGIGVAGLLRYIATLGLAKTALAGVRTTVIALSEAQTLASAGTVALSALGGPAFIALAVATTAAIAAFGFLGNASSTLTASEEELKTKLNEAKAAVDDKKKALEDLNQFIEQTTAKEKLLTTNQDELNAAIAEARTRFGSLSQSVYENVTSFGALIAKVQALRTELRSGLLVDLVNFETATTAKIADAKARIAGLQGSQQVIGSLRAGGFLTGPATDTEGNVQAGYQQALSGNGISQLPKSLQDNASVKSAFSTLQGGTVDPEELAKTIAGVAKLPDEFKGFREDVLRRLNTINAPVRDIITNQGAGKNAAGQRASAELALTPGFKAIENEFTGPETQRVLNGLKNLKDIGDVDQRSQRGAEGIQAAQAAIDRFDKFKSGLSPEEQTALKGTSLDDAVNAAKGDIRKTQTELGLAVTKATVSRAAHTAKEDSLDIQNFQKQLKDEKDPARRDIIIGQLRATEKERADAEREQLRGKAAEAKLAPGADIGTIDSNLSTDLRGVDAKLDTGLRGINDANTQFELKGLDATFQDLKQKLATANHRDGKGKHGTAAEIADLNRQLREVVNQELDLKGITDPGQRQQEIDRRVDQAEIRSGLTGAGRTKADPNRPFVGPRDNQVNSIASGAKQDERAAANAIADSKIPLEEAKTFLDAAKRNNNFPQGVIRAKQKEINSLQLEQEKAETQARIILDTNLTKRLDEAKGLVADDKQQLANLTSQYGIKDLGNGELQGTFGSKEVRAEVTRNYKELVSNIDKLEGKDGLGGELLNLQQKLDANATTLKKLNVEQAVRSQSPETGLGAVQTGFTNAVDQFAEKSGLNDSTVKQSADSFTAIIHKADSSFSTFIQNLAKGGIKGKAAFKDFVVSILQDALKISADKASSQLLGGALGLVQTGLTSIFGGAGAAAGVSAVGSGQGIVDGVGTNAGGFIAGAAPEVGAAFAPVYEGGVIHAFADGGIVPGVHYGRDTVRAKLAPGEGVLNRRAVSLIGEDGVRSLNSASVASQAPIPAPPAPRQPDSVNVYVVDKNTTPALGPKDILAAVHSDILSGGVTKKLIQKVQVGQL